MSKERVWTLLKVVKETATGNCAGTKPIQIVIHGEWICYDRNEDPMESTQTALSMTLQAVLQSSWCSFVRPAAL